VQILKDLQIIMRPVRSTKPHDNILKRKAITTSSNHCFGDWCQDMVTDILAELALSKLCVLAAQEQANSKMKKATLQFTENIEETARINRIGKLKPLRNTLVLIQPAMDENHV
jgi:hypothetical protein